MARSVVWEKKKKERRIITVSWSHIRDVSQVKSDLGEKKIPPACVHSFPSALRRESALICLKVQQMFS